MSKFKAAGAGLLLVGLLFAWPGPSAWAGNTFADGDVFVSLKSGLVQWRGADGTLKAVLVGTSDGHAEGMGFDASGNL